MLDKKIDKFFFCITKTKCKHSKGGHGRLPLSDVYTCHGFFKITSKFEKVEKVDSKTFFHKFIRWLVDKGFSILGNLLLMKIFKPWKWFYTTTSRQTWLPRDLKDKALKQQVNF